MEEASCGSMWSWEQEKAFENALASYPLEEAEEGEEKWERIAAAVPGKTVDDVRLHYDVLLEDIEGIESGRVPLPSYVSSSEGSGDQNDEGGGGGGGKKGIGGSGGGNGDSGRGGKSSRAEQERRKGIAWTEDEHRLFLLGLEKYGKGDWRSISRNFVISRTPTQVASHAQKYFIRLNSMNKDRRRSSIHDITSIDGGDLASPQGPITGQSNGAVASSSKPGKQQPSGIGVYGAPTIGQPVGGPLVSAVGTPVNLPAPPHMAYGVRAPVAGTIVPGAPMNGTPVPYPMKRSSAQR